jgi:hypothetical protein
LQHLKERRSSPRLSTNLSATVVHDDGLSRRTGYITDLSQLGARLQFGSPSALPDFFYLLLPKHQIQPCRIIWRRETELGVEFTSPTDSAAAEPVR